MEQMALELKSLPVGELLERWRKEAAEHRETESAARREAEQKERAVAALEDALGIEPTLDPAEARNEWVGRTLARTTSELRGIAAVRAAIAEDPARVWTPKEIHEVLTSNGWVNRKAEHPLRGTEAAISRLVQRGDLVRVGRGKYRLAGLGVIPED